MANLIGRSPGAVAFKLGNFGSFDPELKKRGIGGLPNTSKLDKEIWDEFLEEDFIFPEGKDRILVSYEAGVEQTAFVEPVAVGDLMPDMPLFLASEYHILVPLESTYRAAWDASPEELRTVVETGILPNAEED